MLDKQVIEEMYTKGLSYVEIAKILNVKDNRVKLCIQRNFQHLKDVHHKNKKIRREEQLKKLRNNDRIWQLYEKGFSYVEIAEMIGFNENTVKSYIERNLQHLKENHYKNKKIRREWLNSVKNENKQWISDFSLVKFYRQSYITNSNGNLVFDKKTRGQATDDLPKKLIVKV